MLPPAYDTGEVMKTYKDELHTLINCWRMIFASKVIISSVGDKILEEIRKLRKANEYKVMMPIENCLFYGQ